MSVLRQSIFFITDQTKVDSFAVCNKLPRGAHVILRDYDLPKRAEFAAEIQKICHKRKLKFLVGKTPKLAIKLKADGMHFPEFMSGEIKKWRYRKPSWIITSACHSSSAAKRINDADFLLLSPVFATASHPEKKPLGRLRSRQIILQNCYKSFIALGGIDEKSIRSLKTIGFSGFAGISGLVNCAVNATKT